MLPIDTNDEKPRRRSEAFSSSASPSAPLCDENAIGPGGSGRGPNVAFEAEPGHGDSEAVWADEPTAVGAHEVE